MNILVLYSCNKSGVYNPFTPKVTMRCWSLEVDLTTYIIYKIF